MPVESVNNPYPRPVKRSHEIPCDMLLSQLPSRVKLASRSTGSEETIIDPEDNIDHQQPSGILRKRRTQKDTNGKGKEMMNPLCQKPRAASPAQAVQQQN